MKIRIIRQSAAVAAALLVVGLGATACSGSSSGGSSSKDPYVLPILDSFSGVGAPNGNTNKLAYELAREEINAAGGIDGRPLEFEYYDDQSSPTVGVQQLHKLPKDSLAVVGVAFSSVGAGVATAAKQIQIPFMTGSIGDGDIVSSGQPWSFSMLAPYQYTLAPMTTTWLKGRDLSDKKLTVLYDNKNAATQRQGMIMADAAKAAGATILKTVQTQTSQPSFTSEAAAIAATDPEAMLVCGLSADAAGMVKSLRAAGVDVPILLCPASTSATFPNLMGNSITNVTLAWNWWYTLPGDSNQKFTEAYKKSTGGQLPSGASPSCYEAVKVVAEALAKTGALTSDKSTAAKRDAIRKYFADLKDWPAVNGSVSMGSKGTVEQPGVLLAYDKGEITLETK